MGKERIELINELKAQVMLCSREGLCGLASGLSSEVLEQKEKPQETAEAFLRKIWPDSQPEGRASFIGRLKGFQEKLPEEQPLRKAEAAVKAPEDKPLPKVESAEAKTPEVEQARYLHVDSREAWDRIKDAMLDTGALKQATLGTEKAEVFLKTLNRFEGAVKKLFAKAPEEIDENSSEDLAAKIIGVLGNYLSQLIQYLDKTAGGIDIAQMAKTMDAYLATLFVERRELKPDANINDWIELNMREDVIVTKSTDDPSKKGKIHEIYVQPRVIRYLDAYEEKCEQYFLGRCCAYKLNE